MNSIRGSWLNQIWWVQTANEAPPLAALALIWSHEQPLLFWGPQTQHHYHGWEQICSVFCPTPPPSSPTGGCGLGLFCENCHTAGLMVGNWSSCESRATHWGRGVRTQGSDHQRLWQTIYIYIYMSSSVDVMIYVCLFICCDISLQFCCSSKP